MDYAQLVKIYEALESTTKKLEKRDILADFYKKCNDDDLPRAVLLSMGLVSTELELGLASEMVKRIIIKTSGANENELIKKLKETGDLGSTAEALIQNKKQRSLISRKLTLDKVFNNILHLPDVTGSGSQERKMALVTELLSSASPKEARYIIRTVLGEMRIGVAAGIVRNAIAITFEKEPKEIEHVYDVTGDYGKVALMAKNNNLKAEIVLGSPIRVMLADRAPDLKAALAEYHQPTIEIKLDGFRAQIHKQGNEIKIFSRRLDEVTKQFPEVVKWSREHIATDKCIIEGEILAIDPKTGNPKPFQKLSRRIQRKYEIEKMVKEIPVRIDLFELIYLNGQNWMNKPLSERWKRLNQIIKPLKGKFDLVDHIETKNLSTANKFYEKSLAMGEEGIIVKNLEAHYQPGRRVGYWLKVKPIMEPLDLVIVGGTWGEGQRTKWIGSLLLAARAGKKFVPTGMMGSGLTESQLIDITGKLKKLIIKESGNHVDVKPEIVVEVAYEEIQRSPKYPSGYALRFPRLIRFREDEKRPEQADTIQTIEKLFKQQRSRKN